MRINIDIMKGARLAKGWRQVDLAEQIGVSEGYIGHIEATGQVNIDRLVTIAQALGIPIRELMIEEDGEENE